MSNHKNQGPFARIWSSIKSLISPPRVKFVR